jgi:transposase
MSESTCLVGLDVHQGQSVAAVLDPLSGELCVERLRGAPGDVVPVFLEALGRPVRAVYEAGPTGFALARAAGVRGLDLRVIAPGSIPRGSGDRVKTDRRDATRLVRLFAAGELSFSFVPSEEEEHFRDLVRCIDDARKDLMRAAVIASRSSCCAVGCASPAEHGLSRTSAGSARCASRTRSPRRCSSTISAQSRGSCSDAAH